MCQLFNQRRQSRIEEGKGLTAKSLKYTNSVHLLDALQKEKNHTNCVTELNMDVILTGGFGRTSSSLTANKSACQKWYHLLKPIIMKKKWKIHQITFRACHIFLFFLQGTIAIRYSQDPGGRI